MKKNRSILPMRTAKTGYLVISALLCAFGVLLMARPEFSTVLFGRVLGVCMVVFGVIKLVGYFSKDLFRLAFQYDLAFGILLMALGVIALARPGSTMSFLCVILGVCVLADGLFKVQIAIDARTFGIRSWWLILVFAILSGAFGVLLVLRPSESARLLAVFLGLALLAEGIMNLCVALCTVKIVAHQKPDVVEIEEYTIF